MTTFQVPTLHFICVNAVTCFNMWKLYSLFHCIHSVWLTQSHMNHAVIFFFEGGNVQQNILSIWVPQIIFPPTRSVYRNHNIPSLTTTWKSKGEKLRRANIFALHSNNNTMVQMYFSKMRSGYYIISRWTFRNINKRHFVSLITTKRSLIFTLLIFTWFLT